MATRPVSVSAEASVMDVNRQAWNAQTGLLVHPADLYVGLRSPRTFPELPSLSSPRKLSSWACAARAHYDWKKVMTNKDIAQALFVTPKTVEVHLSSVYRKLEISSRGQLPDVLGATT